MKTFFALAVLIAVPAFASRPTLENRDGKKYDYDLECGASTQHSSVGSHTTTTLDAKCKLKVKGAGAAKLDENMKCVIKDSMLDCN